jgi:hypothetical protein
MVHKNLSGARSLLCQKKFSHVSQDSVVGSHSVRSYVCFRAGSPKGEEITPLSAVVGVSATLPMVTAEVMLPLGMLSFFGRGSAATSQRDHVYAMQVLVKAAAKANQLGQLGFGPTDYNATVAESNQSLCRSLCQPRRRIALLL